MQYNFFNNLKQYKKADLSTEQNIWCITCSLRLLADWRKINSKHLKYDCFNPSAKGVWEFLIHF